MVRDPPPRRTERSRRRQFTPGFRQVPIQVPGRAVGFVQPRVIGRQLDLLIEQAARERQVALFDGDSRPEDRRVRIAARLRQNLIENLL